MYQSDWLPRLSRFARDANVRASWRVPANVWGLGTTSLLTDVSSEMIVSILPAYLVLTGGLAPLALGLAAGLHDGGPMLAAWIGGALADRSGRRKLTAGAGYVLSAACRFGWLLVPGRAVGAIAALILGDRVGKAVRTAPRDAMISLSVGPAHLATAFGVHRAMDAAGAALGPVLAFVLLWQLPRRYDVIFFTSSVIALLGVAALTLLVSDPQPAHAPASTSVDEEPFWPGALAVFHDPALRRVLAVAAACSLATISDAFLYLLLVQHSNAGVYWVPLLYTGTALAFLVLAVPFGRLADRLGRFRTYLLAHAPLLAAYMVAWHPMSRWPWSATVCVGLLGAYYAASDGVLAGLAGGMLPVRTRAVGLAWIASAVGGARLASALLFGLLWTRFGDRAAVAAFGGGLLMVLAFALVTTTAWRDERVQLVHAG